LPTHLDLAENGAGLRGISEESWSLGFCGLSCNTMKLMPGIYENAIANLRRYVGDAFKPGTALFPYYTLHGTEHLEELDRLALLVGAAIPGLTEERLGLLRLAIVIHDFAMVDIPDEIREEELRRRLGNVVPLADVVRKTHQDEIERCFAESQRIEFLMGLIPGATPALLEDVATIAKHHRLHPLDRAPVHLQDLCALMRILDELDLGPRRAPADAYEALRSRMEPEAKMHWLKHICSRAISHPTFSIVITDHLRILKVAVVVTATELTWEPLQNLIIDKLESCLEREGVNAVLREKLQVEFQVAPSLAIPSRPTFWLSKHLREDLDSPGVSALLRSKYKRGPTPISAENLVTPSAPSPELQAPKGINRSAQEFKVIAVPPERLAEFLCKSGRLTVICNTYVVPDEESVSGVVGAASRFFVGPADSGKTRAALEWIDRIISPTPSQWAIFRTDIGTLPTDVSTIVLDKTLYGELPMPTKAILFLDDFPTNLPSPGDPVMSAEEAVRGFFRWFRELSFLRDRRVAGTIRVEDLHARPDWPDMLPSLGQELELVRLRPLDAQRYRRLWKGMGAIGVSRSMSRGVESFAIDLKPEFLEAVSERSADPEAVATFVQQNALKARTVLRGEDADSFLENAGDTWRRQTWPALHQTYGVAAKVFFTLARFVEASLRTTSGFLWSMGPHWAYHEQWGPELCTLQGGAAGAYLPTLEQLIADGHATGERGVRIRPKLDFLLQAETLSGIDFGLPHLSWFVQRSSRFEASIRRDLAMQLSSSGLEAPGSQDASLLLGWGAGTLLFLERTGNENQRSALLDRSIATLQEATELDPEDSSACVLLGFSLGRKADQESDSTRAAVLRDEQIAAYRSAINEFPNASEIWSDFGIALGKRADEASDPTRVAELRDEQIAAYRSALKQDPNNSLAWSRLGISLGKKADRGPDSTKAKLRNRQVAAHRCATQADPTNSLAWINLGISLGEKAGQERNPAEAAELRDEQIAAYRSATQTDPNSSLAWKGLGISLGLKAGQEGNPARAAELQEEAIASLRSATRVDSEDSNVWLLLGTILGQQASQFNDLTEVAELLDEAITACRNAAQTDPENSLAWTMLGGLLVQKGAQIADPKEVTELVDEAIAAGRDAIQAGTKDVGSDPRPESSLAWCMLGTSLEQKAGKESDLAKAAELRDEAIAAFHSAMQADSESSLAWSNWYYLGISLGKKADQESEPTRAAELRDEAIAAFRSSTRVDPKSSVACAAWNNLGVNLRKRADQEGDPARAAELRGAAIAAFRSATQVDPKGSAARTAWENLGANLEEKAEQESDPMRATELRDEVIVSYRSATQADPKSSLTCPAWYYLGVNLDKKANQERYPMRVAELRDEAIAAYRSAIQADPESSLAHSTWNYLGVNLEKRADQVSDPTRAAELRDEAIAIYRSATQGDPRLAGWAWSNIGINLDKKADQESYPSRAAELRDESIAGYRSAMQVCPSLAGWALRRLGISLVKKANQESDPARKATLRSEAIANYLNAMQPENIIADSLWDSGFNLSEKANQESNSTRKAELELQDEAIVTYRSAAQANPSDSRAWDNLTFILSRKAKQESDPTKAAELRAEVAVAVHSSREANPNPGFVTLLLRTLA
jgi:hypothetical protein